MGVIAPTGTCTARRCTTLSRKKRKKYNRLLGAPWRLVPVFYDSLLAICVKACVKKVTLSHPDPLVHNMFSACPLSSPLLVTS